MARISVGILPDGSQLGLTLDRYADIMRLPSICAFNGINRPTEYHDSQCIDIVGQSMRDMLAQFLFEAEQMREEELGYYLGRKWRQEEQNIGWDNPFILDMKYLVSMGTPTTVAIEEGAALDLGGEADPNNPVELIVTTAVDVSEIVVRYPGEAVDIHPTSVVRLDGTVRIRIPRCRLVHPDHLGDLDDPPSYYNNSIFLTTVDVWRIYADESTGAEFVWKMPDCITDCTPRCQPACPIIIGADAHRLSIVNLHPAAYSSGTWKTGCWAYNSCPDAIRVRYLSGRQSMRDEILTIRLAHTLMPYPPCTCDIAKQAWAEDREWNERGISPYGARKGAIEAWIADSRAKVGHGGIFPGMGR